MTVIDYIVRLDGGKHYLPVRGVYDDLFLTMIEYHLRAAKSCIVLDYKHLDGVAGQELLIKDKWCAEMYIIFVRLVSDAINPIYILAVLKERLISGYFYKGNAEDDLPLSRGYVMYLLLEFSITGEPGILPKAKEIANLSITLCSAETSSYCFGVCEEIRRLEEDRYAQKFC